MKDLSLPSEMGLELGFLKTPFRDEKKLNLFKQMKFLEFLHIGNEAGFIWFRDENGGLQIEHEKHIQILQQHFPRLIINKMTLIDTPHLTDPSYNFFNERFPEFGMSFQAF